jgi:SET domain-containing protein
MPRLSAPLYAVRNSGIHGKGGFAVRRIRKGTRITEYVGERITPEEGDRRYPINGQSHYHTFLFLVNKKICIDAAVDGNDARFLNHSCDPNCEAVEDNGRVFIEAIRTIEPGVELTYDYHLTGSLPRTKAAQAQFACDCGAPGCRGTMLNTPKPSRNGKRR